MYLQKEVSNDKVQAGDSGFKEEVERGFGYQELQRAQVFSKKKWVFGLGFGIGAAKVWPNSRNQGDLAFLGRRRMGFQEEEEEAGFGIRAVEVWPDSRNQRGLGFLGKRSISFQEEEEEVGFQVGLWHRRC